jgi:Fe-S cluster assembly ATP-binding protein
MLEIKNLKASVNNKDILKGLNISIKPGELHAIMGPNGSGKSTLANILSGKEGYKISGELKYQGEDLQEIPIDIRAQKGIFLAFQYPTEIPGVNTRNFLRTSLNKVRKAQGKKEIDALSFIRIVKEKSSELGMDEKMLSRQLNVGFSGGEKKKNEILQMKILEPDLTILDETDSGLDIDALKIVAEGVNSSRNDKKSFLVITHYQRLLNFIKPDFVHVLADGKIVKSGSMKLAEDLEKTGYKGIN